ncbi:hypothetical protein BSPWISOXPB_860 [uncultured Gammaproteobacteria bacterium]|nr:hypothetical protein BSPWISOXPB_860 [uncultured Gammaproteobacteria bacterium]
MKPLIINTISNAAAGLHDDGKTGGLNSWGNTQKVAILFLMLQVD